MFVRECMIENVITVTPDTSIHEAMDIMHQKKIRHMPVVDAQGQLKGIVSDKDLVAVSPSPSTLLSRSEMNYILTKLKIKDVMTVNVITVSEDTPMEEAAAILADNKIGGLPVVRAGKLAGIITATDLFNIFTYMLGARHSGVRAAAVIPGVKGTLAKITAAIAAAGGDILTFSEYQDGQGQWHLTLKITDLPREKIEAVLQSLVEKVIDVRDSPAIKPK